MCDFTTKGARRDGVGRRLATRRGTRGWARGDESSRSFLLFSGGLVLDTRRVGYAIPPRMPRPVPSRGVPRPMLIRTGLGLVVVGGSVAVLRLLMTRYLESLLVS